MWITTTYVRQHKLTSAILLYLLCMIFIHLVKPSLFYEEEVIIIIDCIYT